MRERLLWATVLNYGLHDHARGRDTKWLHSRDFEDVCFLAGMDPDYARRLFEPERVKRLPHVLRQEAA